MDKRTFIATAAAIFAATTFVTAAQAADVRCGGTNACKGQGFTEAKDAAACTTSGGKVL